MIAKQEIWVFGDGACKGNPGPGGWGVVIASADLVVELGGGSSVTTNNEMELTALAKALAFVGAEGQKSGAAELLIFFDSKYVLEGAKFWRFAWAKNNWKSSQNQDLKNLELWKEIDAKLRSLPESLKLNWRHVEGHSDISGNERADEIASSFAEGISVELFRGRLQDYPVNLTGGIERARPLTRSRQKTKMKSEGSSYYLSFVGGELHRDSSWKACEARVKGVRGAKYKKVSSKSEEEEMLRKWGL
ncbi:MAG: ribonuclease HI [Bradymonadales bacterium]|nr:MAG: ribonuclease HI [Bradymonadales bacterium]